MYVTESPQTNSTSPVEVAEVTNRPKPVIEPSPSRGHWGTGSRSR